VHTNLGIGLGKIGDLEGAIAEYRIALSINPKDTKAHVNLGVVLLQERGDLEGAVAEYQSALRIDPDLAKAHSNLGAALVLSGDEEGAIAEFQAALRIDPNDAMARDYHAILGYSLGKG
jgi:Flp pilus assembly protein TadD